MSMSPPLSLARQDTTTYHYSHSSLQPLKVDPLPPSAPPLRWGVVVAAAGVLFVLLAGVITFFVLAAGSDQPEKNKPVADGGKPGDGGALVVHDNRDSPGKDKDMDKEK